MKYDHGSKEKKKKKKKKKKSKERAMRALFYPDPPIDTTHAGANVLRDWRC